MLRIKPSPLLMLGKHSTTILYIHRPLPYFSISRQNSVQAGGGICSIGLVALNLIPCCLSSIRVEITGLHWAWLSEKFYIDSRTVIHE